MHLTFFVLHLYRFLEGKSVSALFIQLSVLKHILLTIDALVKPYLSMYNLCCRAFLWYDHGWSQRENHWEKQHMYKSLKCADIFIFVSFNFRSDGVVKTIQFNDDRRLLHCWGVAERLTGSMQDHNCHRF